MSISVHRLIDYYRSSSYVEDHAYIDRHDPSAAELERYAIIGSLNENLEKAGFKPTQAEIAVQLQFVAGNLSLPDMLEQIEMYVASISRRRSSAPEADPSLPPA